MKCLVFKVRGDYARFRKSYTTTSALTYLLIHPVAVRGLIGAMLGIDREKLYEKTKDIEVAIQVVNQVRKDMQSFNLVNMKPNDKIFRFPSNIEFLRNVEYRIFIKAEDKTLYEVDNCIKQGEYIFTPYLGSSEHIAKIDYEGIYNCEKLRSLELYSTTMDWGAGVFTGCFGVEAIRSYVDETQKSCMKELLMELRQSLVVSYVGKGQAMLIFSDFFE